jgi:hypothetical protein
MGAKVIRESSRESEFQRFGISCEQCFFEAKRLVFVESAKVLKSGIDLQAIDRSSDLIHRSGRTLPRIPEVNQIFAFDAVVYEPSDIRRQ